MQVTRAAFQAVASLNEQATDPKSHTLVSIAYTLSCPVLSPANSDGRPQYRTFDQMFIALNRKTLKAPLPDMSAATIMFVIATHVTREQPLHELT